MTLPRNLSWAVVPSMNEESGRKEGSQSPPANAGEGEQSNILSSLSMSGPLSSSARVAILATLLAIRRTTFTELMLAVNVPKSSLNLSLSVLKENKFITVRRGFLAVGGPRTIVEITSEGEKAIMGHLFLMQRLAKRLLPGSDSLPTTDCDRHANPSGIGLYDVESVHTLSPKWAHTL